MPADAPAGGALLLRAGLRVTLPAAVGIMRPAKSVLIALQYRYRAREMGL